MNLLAIACGPLGQWVVRATVQASLLIVVILSLQKIMGDRLGVRARYGLWLVLLVRMAMPWAPQSRVSLYNVLPPSLTQGKQTSAAVGPNLTGSASWPMHRRGGVEDVGDGDESGTSSTGDLHSQNEYWPVGRTVRGLLLFWLLGVCYLASYTFIGSVRLWRVVQGGQLVTNRETLDLLDACRRLIGTRAAVDVVVTDRLGSPALFGLFRPRLLLPRQTLEEVGPAALRHIFLHELAHLKRHDILVDSIASVLHILHWFNPLVTVAMRRMRADRELACDAMALSLLAPEETSDYGRTIVGQIERLFASRCRPAMIGLCGVRTRVRQRIAMIAQFEKKTYRWSILPVVLVAALACVGLTEGRVANRIVDWASVDRDLYARQDFPTTHTDRHANIQRAYIQNRLTRRYLVGHGDTVTCDANEPGPEGLWEYRFDEVTNKPDVPVYLYSVAARKYLGTDEEGRLTVDAREPDETARWGAWPNARGVWLISHHCKDGYLCLTDDGGVAARGRDAGSYWDIHAVWRVKTSDDPASNPQWQREKIPGPD